MTRFVVLDPLAPRVASEPPGSARSLRVTLGRDDVSAHVNEGLSFSNADPGGFEVSSFSLPRDVRVPQGTPIAITHGLETAWEGRVADVERSLASGAGASHETKISGEGYGARLRDGDMSMVYCDRDLSGWGDMPAADINFYVGQGYSVHPPEGRGGADGIPAVSTRFPGKWTDSYPLCEAHYDADGGNRIASVWLDPQYERIPSAGSGGVFTGRARSSTASFSAFTGSHAWSPTLPGTDYWTPGMPRQFMVLELFHSEWPGGIEGRTYGIHWRNLTVYGDHGLTRRGANPGGFYPSDIIGHVVDQLPGIARGDLQTASGFVVPHASYRVPVAHEQIVADMNGYVGWHWGTWEARGALAQGLPRFDFRPPPSAKTAWAARRDMDGLQLIERLSELYNRVRVAYDTPTGKRRYASGSLTVPELDAVGISRTLLLEIGVSTQTAANAMVSVIAGLLLDRTRRIAGSASMRGQVGTPAGSKPALLLRAGLDRLGIPDLPANSLLSGTDNEIHIRRVESTVGREGPSTSVELGAGADLLEVLSARVESRTSILTGGG